MLPCFNNFRASFPAFFGVFALVMGSLANDVRAYSVSEPVSSGTNEQENGNDNEKTDGALRWVSGYELPGRIVSFDDGHLVWQSSKLFSQPLKIKSERLKTINYTQSKPANSKLTKTKSGFTLQFNDGSILTGDIISVDSTSLVFESKKTGRLTVPRENIRSFVSRSSRFASNRDRMDLEVWTADRGEKKFWKLNSERHIESTRQNSHLYLREEFADSVLIEFEVSWKKKLDFIIGFGVPRNTRQIEKIPRLEVWEDSLVFFFEDSFEPVIESIDSSDKTLKLAVLWNRKKGDMLIRDQAGNQLAFFKVPPAGKNVKNGFFLQNKLGDVTLSALSAWQAGAEFDASKPSVHIEGQDSKNGELLSFDGSIWKVKIQDETREFSTTDFKGAFLALGSGIQSSTQKLTFFNGDRIPCELVSIERGHASVKTRFLGEQVLRLKLDDLKQLNWVQKTTTKMPVGDPVYNSVLWTKSGSMAGRLVPGSGKENDVLRWEVPGAVGAVPFAYGDSKVSFEKTKSKPEVGQAKRRTWPDTLYLVNGDILPCRIGKMDESTVYFESFTEANKIASQYVKAVDLHNINVENAFSIEDPLWKSGRGVKKVAKRFSLSKGGEIQHSQLLATGNLKFRAKWVQQGCLECQVYRSANDGSGVDIRLGLFRNAVFVSNQQGNPVGKTYACKDNSAVFEFRTVSDKVEVRCDGQLIYSRQLKPRQNEGTGCRFRMLNTFGSRSKVQLSDFTGLVAEFGNGNLVQKARRELLLTIPRLKKELPPKNILCARNYDLLRGDVVELNDRQVKVRTDGEVSVFPRDVISTIVWLHAEHLALKESESDEKTNKKAGGKADKKPNKAETETEGEVQFVLAGNRRMSSFVSGWENGCLVGDSDTLGACQIPLEEILELRMGSFTNKSKDVPYANWVAQLAPSPKMETGGKTNSDSNGFGQSSPLIGQKLGALELVMLSGPKRQLDDFRGKIVVLDFWATWCAPCIKSLPKIQQVVAGFPEDQVILIAVNQEESKNQIRKFLKRKKWDLKNIVMDAGPLSRIFNVDAIPKTVIVDSKGVVKYVKVGTTSDFEEKLKQSIQLLLDANAEALSN